MVSRADVVAAARERWKSGGFQEQAGTGGTTGTRTDYSGYTGGGYTLEPASVKDVDAPVAGSFAEKHGMTEEVARDTIDKYQRNPAADEYKSLKPNEIIDLNKAAGLDQYTNLRQIGAGQVITQALYDEIKKKGAGYARTVDKRGLDPYISALKSEEKAAKESAKQYEREHVIIDGKAMTIKDFNDLPDKYRSVAIKEGFDAMTRTMAADQKQYTANNVIIDGKAMSVTDFNSLSPEYRSLAIRKGYDALAKQMEADAGNRDTALNKLKGTLQMVPVGDYYNVRTGETISTAEYKKLGASAKRDQYVKNYTGLGEQKPDGSGQYDFEKLAEYARNNGIEDIQAAGFDAETIKDIKEYNAAVADAKITRYENVMTGKVITAAEYKKIKGADRDLYRLSTASGLGADIQKGVSIAADVVVPGLYVAKNWNELGANEKAMYIAVDALGFMFVLRGATAGARASQAVTRMGTMKGAALGAGREVLAQLRAPIDLVIHPLKGAKAAVRNTQDAIENVASLRKVSGIVATTSYGTVRLPVSMFKTPEGAMAARDTIMKMAKAGDARIMIEAEGNLIEVARSPLMKEAGGGLAHATPTGEVFEGGLKVAAKPTLKDAEQGLFMSHEPLPRFTEATAYGKTGVKPTIYIVSPETAEKALSSGKLYKSPTGTVAELESVFKVGTELPAPAQRLYTRMGTELEVVELLLEKPLTTKQLLKLKALGVAENVKALFTPAARITSLEGKEVKAAASILEDAGNVSQARSLRRAAELADSRRAAAPATRAVRTYDVNRKSYEKAMDRVRQYVERQRPELRAILPRIERAISSERITSRAEVDSLIDRLRSAKRDSRGRVIVTDSRGRVGVKDSRGRTERADSRGRTERTAVPERTARAETAERIERPARTVGTTRAIRTDTTTRITEPVRAAKFTPDMSDAKKRKIVEKAPGAITWRQGELQGRDVWHVIKYPYQSKDDHTTIMGKMPPGAKLDRGPHSAFITATRLYGKPPSHEVKIDMGLQDITLGAGAKIRFTADPDQLTRGDFAIGGKSPFPLEKKKVSKPSRLS